MSKLKFAILYISSIRLLPHLILFNTHKNKTIIQYEVDRWLTIKGLQLSRQTGFVYLMTFFPEFRNLFYYRIGHSRFLVAFLCPSLDTLYIFTKSIGPGLFIQHGFATIISAHTIGRDCWINQQVTIGFANATDAPTIGDNVSINAGAKVIGGVTVGSNSKIGAGTVVVKNVPENSTVVGGPAYVIRKGSKVKELLA